MNIFERIDIRGFRRLYDASLELKPLNVLIGANGSGKTSLLDAFSLLAASASGELDKFLSKLGGFQANLTNLDAASEGRADAMTLALALQASRNESVTYRLALGPEGTSYRITEETLAQDSGKPRALRYFQARNGDLRYLEGNGSRSRKGLVRPTWAYRPDESALYQVPKMDRPAEELRRRLLSLARYHVIDVGHRAPVRLPQPLRHATHPGMDGEDLIPCLYNLRETDPSTFEAIEATLQVAYPGFEQLKFPAVAAGTLALTWKDQTSRQPFYMNQLSEGTLRFLWLVTLLHCPDLAPLTVIDEPEVSLHPRLMALLVDLLRETSRRAQLVIATHSDRLVSFLKPHEVVVVNVNDRGCAELQRADRFDLDSWLEEYTLDEVWRMGHIGGVP